MQQHKSQHSWGTGTGRSSSASAFSLSLDNEIDVALGYRAVTLMIDLWKCFERIDPSTLMQEAQAVQYPLRMAWMLIQAYRQPRTLRAHGSASRFFVSEQGIIAGCSHATTVLEVLLYRAMRRLSSRCPTITPRQLVDDISLKWAGTAELCAEEVGEAADEACEALENLRLPVQVKKLGYVASNASTEKLLRGTANRRFIAKRRWMRNLGHELTTAKPQRQQEAERMAALRAGVRKRRQAPYGLLGLRARASRSQFCTAPLSWESQGTSSSLCARWLGRLLEPGPRVRSP